MAAAIVGITAPFDQLAILELVQQSDEVAAVVTERVSDRRLRLAGPLVEESENRVVHRVQAGRLEGRELLLLHLPREVLEQKGRAGQELSRRPGRRRLDERFYVRCRCHGNKCSPANRCRVLLLMESTILEGN
jgi:hypothetical protein